MVTQIILCSLIKEKEKLEGNMIESTDMDMEHSDRGLVVLNYIIYMSQ